MLSSGYNKVKIKFSSITVLVKNINYMLERKTNESKVESKMIEEKIQKEIFKKMFQKLKLKLKKKSKM